MNGLAPGASLTHAQLKEQFEESRAHFERMKQMLDLYEPHQPAAVTPPAAVAGSGGAGAPHSGSFSPSRTAVFASASLSPPAAVDAHTGRGVAVHSAAAAALSSSPSHLSPLLSASHSFVSLDSTAASSAVGTSSSFSSSPDTQAQDHQYGDGLHRKRKIKGKDEKRADSSVIHRCVRCALSDADHTIFMSLASTKREAGLNKNNCLNPHPAHRWNLGEQWNAPYNQVRAKLGPAA